MDIKKIIETVTAKLKKDPDLLASFKKDPEKTIEGLTGIDIPDGMFDKVIDGVKEKIAKEAVSGLAGKLSGLFKK